MKYILYISLVLLSNNLFADDWDFYRQQIRDCPRTDAHCVGLKIINILEETSPIERYTTLCTCDRTGLSCRLKYQSGRSSVINGRIPYIFSSDCRDNLTAIQSKGLACAQESGKTVLWQINDRAKSFARIAEFTFKRDCEIERDRN